MNHIKHQLGLSMVELLIALAISSFLILGITQVYIDNKRNYVFQQNQAGNAENSRFAALIINDYLGKAGYRRTPSALLEIVFPPGRLPVDASRSTQDMPLPDWIPVRSRNLHPLSATD